VHTVPPSSKPCRVLSLFLTHSFFFFLRAPLCTAPLLFLFTLPPPKTPKNSRTQPHADFFPSAAHPLSRTPEKAVEFLLLKDLEGTCRTRLDCFLSCILQRISRFPHPDAQSGPNMRHFPFSHRKSGNPPGQLLSGYPLRHLPSAADNCMSPFLGCQPFC